MSTQKMSLTLSVVASVLAFVAMVWSAGWSLRSLSNDQIAGVPGTIYAEDYDPYIRQNDGYNSQYGITTSARLHSSGTFKVGTDGTALSMIIASTCNLATGATNCGNGFDCPFEATTTRMHYCSITGVLAGDVVIVTPKASLAGAASSTPNTGKNLFGGLLVTGAVATTTDRIGVSMLNLTGAATSSYTGATTSVSVTVYR